MGIRQRQRHRDLAIVLLAELAAILPRHPHRMLPFLGKPVSSMIQASIGPCRSIAGSTISRTLARTVSSDQRPSPTKCNSDWCCAAVRSGAVTAAIGSTLLRSQGSISPRQ